MISSLESGYGIEELSADRTSPAAAPEPAVEKNDDGKFHFFGKNGLQFSDLLDAINPLQQLPIIGTLYREITGEVITPAARLVGGAIYGGPIGAIASALDDAFEYVTGSDVGKTVVALVTHGEMPHAPGEDTGETMLADASKDGGTIEDIPPAPAAAAVPVIKVASAALEGSAAPSFAMASLPQPPAAEAPIQVASAAAAVPAAAPGPAAVSTMAATQVAEFPHARLVNRTGVAETAPGQRLATAAQPQLAATAILSVPVTRAASGAAPSAPVSVPQAPAAQISMPAQLAEAPAAAPTATPSPSSPQVAMTIGAAAAADEAKTQRQPGAPGLGGIGMGSYGMRPSASGLAAQTMQGMPIASMGGDQSNAANALAQISATGMTRSGLPTAGAATPASVMVDARNASAPGANPAAAFSGGMASGMTASPAAAYAAGAAAPSTSLLPPRRINVAPRMPIQAFQQAPNHTAVDLPGQSSVPAAKSTAAQSPAPVPLQEPMAAAPAAAPAVPADTVATAATPSAGSTIPATAAAIPDAMARALDKYDALVKGKRGNGVDRAY